MNLLLQLNAKNNLFIILTNHLKTRWKINNKYICLYSLLACFILSLPFISSIITLHSDSFPENIFTISLVYLLAVVGILLVLIHRKRPMIDKVFYELQYSLDTFSIINRIYDKIVNKYISNRLEYSFFVRKKLDYTRLDDYVVNLVIIKLFKLYFDNINNKENGNNTIPSNVLNSLFNDSDFDSFYSYSFFSNLGDKDHIKIIIGDAVLQHLLKKEWYKEYYEPNKIGHLISYIVDLWYTNFITYEMHYHIKK